MPAKRSSLRSVLLLSIVGASVGAVIITALVTVGLARIGAGQRAVTALRSEASNMADVASGLPCTDVNRPAQLARQLGARARFIPDGSRRPLAQVTETEGRAAILGRDVYFSSVPATICGTSGRLFVFTPVRDAPVLPAGFGARLLLAGLIALGGSALIAYLLARRMSRPLNELAEAARAFKVPAAPSASDTLEVAELKESFTGMVTDLQDARDREKAFLLSISHELRTPLTAIRGYSEALADGTARQPKQAGEVMLGESKRLERLVQDLLDLGRIEAGEFGVDPRPVDLGDVATSVVDALRPMAKEQDVALVLEAPQSVVVRTDPDRVHQMIANLVENAVRVTPAKRAVTVEVAPGSVLVRDEGPGLDPQDVAHAFERFYLWRRYRGERPVGTGLGLAIVGELARRLGVKMDVDSDGKNGTTFEMRF
jgi:two-component system OmpR family sensor kinase